MKILAGILFSGLFFMASLTYAVDVTPVSSNWNCTTNASSSDNSVDKVADNKMASKVESASKAFSYASKHCRDCTKITCSVK